MTPIRRAPQGRPVLGREAPRGARLAGASGRVPVLAAMGWLVGGTLLPAAHAEDTGSKGLTQCAAIAADADRLACYDRLARRLPAAKPAVAGAPGAGSVAPGAQAGAPTGSQPGTTPSAGSAPATSSDTFGITKAAARPLEPKQVEGRVLQVTSGTGGVDLVHLDNAQVWAVDDGPSLLKAGDDVVVRRAALGSFILTTPSKRVFRVRRLR